MAIDTCVSAEILSQKLAFVNSTIKVDVYSTTYKLKQMLKSLSLLQIKCYNKNERRLMKKIKAFFSKAGQAFMLPIALLPAAGILLGVGQSFTNPTFLESYPQLVFLQPGAIGYNILKVMAVAGDVIFANLPLLFAVGLAIGLAKKEKGAAALSAIIGYFVMLIVAAEVLKMLNYNPNIFNLPFLNDGIQAQTDAYIQSLVLQNYGVDGVIDIPTLESITNAASAADVGNITIQLANGGTQSVDGSLIYEIMQDKPLVNGEITLLHQGGALTNTLNIQNTLSMGVFGAIISGLVTVSLHNKFIDAQLPPVLGFFSGPRLIPIISAFAGIILGAVCAVVWPLIGTGLSMLGTWISGLGAVGSLLFGVIERALIPFGLHHVFYTPLWQTPVGGSETIVVNGVPEVFYGTQNMFFAHLSTGTLQDFTSTNFMSGKFPFMIFGLPGAALAMYSVALPKNRKVVGGMLLSVAFTSMLTGITEPIEFTFLFLAPALYYLIHVPLAGISFMLMDLLGVKIGMTFSGGLIDYTMFGLIPQFTGQDVHAWAVPLVGIFYFVIYFFVFRFFILKFNVMTPGRSDDDLELKTKADFKAKQEKKAQQTTDGDLSLLDQQILEALGGADNIEDLDACITRLRVTVKDASKVKDNDYWVKNLGAKGLVVQGNGIQAIYGAEAKVHKNALATYLGLE